MTDNDWIKQLQSTMECHQEPVPDDLWQGIEAQLPKRHAPRRPLRTWRRIAAAVAAALVTAVGCYLLWQAPEQSTRPPAIASASVGGVVIEQATSTAEAADVASVPSQVSPGTVTTHTRSIHTCPTHRIEPFTPAEAPEPEQSQPEQQNKTDLQTEPQRSQPAITSSHEDEPLLANNESNEGHQPRTIRCIQHRHPLVTMGLFAANGFGGGKWDDSDLFVFEDQAVDFGGHAPTEPNTYYPEDVYHATHHAPYSLGLSMKFPLNNHWAVTSGVVYTRVKSDFTTEQNTRVQTLHYIGVPLGLVCNIWNYRRLGIYATGGLQADFNVKATLTQQHSEKLAIGKDRVQFSVMLGPGVQLDLAHGLGVYFEPTARYYLDNGSGLQNYYKDKPFNLNLNAGLRFTLR